jgi:segregation and condensation protein B
MQEGIQNITTDALIEALLFSRKEPWNVSELAKALGEGEEVVRESIGLLESSLLNRGLMLVRANDAITLGTKPEAHVILQKIYKEELEKTLSKASVETLAIVMYGEGVTRGMIDYIRGVNSSFILRSLLMRGLVERVVDARDRKRFVYMPTVELLTSFGVGSTNALPDYERIHSELLKGMSGGEQLENNETI